jgi:hypothetical protein
MAVGFFALGHSGAILAPWQELELDAEGVVTNSTLVNGVTFLCLQDFRS